MENEVRFVISQYLDGTLEIECKHMPYMFDDRFNYDKIPKECLFDRMTEIQEHCDGEGISAKFVIL